VCVAHGVVLPWCGGAIATWGDDGLCPVVAVAVAVAGVTGVAGVCLCLDNEPIYLT